jgi:hypothetical protein
VDLHLARHIHEPRRHPSGAARRSDIAHPFGPSTNRLPTPLKSCCVEASRPDSGAPPSPRPDQGRHRRQAQRYRVRRRMIASGGVGGLKIWWAQARGGSIPLPALRDPRTSRGGDPRASAGPHGAKSVRVLCRDPRRRPPNCAESGVGYQQKTLGVCRQRSAGVAPEPGLENRYGRASPRGFESLPSATRLRRPPLS